MMPKFIKCEGSIFLKIIEINEETGNISITPGTELLSCEWEEVIRLITEIEKKGDRQ